MVKATKTRSMKLTQALHYAQKGWPVLPLHSIVEGICTCGKVDCRNQGKHPLTANGLKDATNEADKIKAWWKQWPKANLGILTGIESGLVVLDIDPRNGGVESLADLIKKHGPLPKTVCVNTGGGGQHYYFKHPGGNIRGRHDSFGKGVDLKADGGYVVAPPSLHVSGKVYQWVTDASPDNIELADMPGWMRQENTKPKSLSSIHIGKIPEGQRNSTLAEKAGSLRRKGLSENEILPLLLNMNANKCDPPLAESEVRSIAASIASYPPNETDDNDSQATALVKLAEQADLFHNPDKQGFAVFTVDDHKECWPLNSATFERWLRGQYYRASGKAPGLQAFQSALSILQCRAIIDGKEENVYVRVAGIDSKIYVDLGDPKWHSVEVTANGWTLLKDHRIRFIRSNTTRALPEPVSGGSLNDLRKFLNLDSDNDWILLASWLVGTLQPNGPYPLLVVTGEQGSAKSTVCRVLRSLIDTQQPDLRSQPHDERDLMISASRSWILAYDNLSKIAHGMSDALCRLSIGGGFATRQLYSDSEEQVFDCKRPVILNGIADLTNRSDLLDRSINLVLPPIQNTERLPESVYWKKFDDLKPRIFGALLDVTCDVLRRLDKVNLPQFPRMADFARWATAAESALGFKAGSFLQAYHQNQEIYRHESVESSAIGPVIIKFMKDKKTWSGTANELLTKCSKDYYLDLTKRRSDWPKTPRGMSGALRRIAPDLRALGIDVGFMGKQGHNGDRILTLRTIDETPPASPVPPSQQQKPQIIKVTKVKRIVPQPESAGDAGGTGGCMEI